LSLLTQRSLVSPPRSRAAAAAACTRGSDALTAGALNEAAEAFSAAIRAHPAPAAATCGDDTSLASLFTWRATALQRLGHAAAAERDCDRALELDKARAAPWRMRAPLTHTPTKSSMF
jgi:hypothetical protein